VNCPIGIIGSKFIEPTNGLRSFCTALRNF
jgi:hypothetical protein